MHTVGYDGSQLPDVTTVGVAVDCARIVAVSTVGDVGKVAIVKFD